MRSLDIITRSGRSLLSSRIRTLLTALAIAVGAFALTLTLGASNGVQNYADTIVRDNFDPAELIVTADGSLFNAVDNSRPQEYDQSFGSVLSPGGAAQVKMLDDDDVNRLKTIPGVQSVQPLNVQNLQYVTRDGQRKYVASAQIYNSYKAPDLLAGSLVGGLKDGTVILPEGFLTAMGFNSPQSAIGKTIRIATQQQVDPSEAANSIINGDTTNLSQRNSQETTFIIAAVSKKPSVLLQASMALYITTTAKDITVLNEQATRGSANYHQYVSVTATVKDGTDTSKLQTTQASIKKAGYGAQSVVDTQKTITQVIGVLQAIVTVFGLIAVVASVFGVVNTMYISVLQRTREIGLMKALGMHKIDITKLFLFEAGLLGFIGGALGSLLGVVTGVIMNPFISKWLDIGDTRLIDFQAQQIIALIVALSIVAIFAGSLPARKAARLDPIVALRSE